MKTGNTVRIALAIASMAATVPAARAASTSDELTKKTTYEIAAYALRANHATGFHLYGGPARVVCGTHANQVPSRMICQALTNIADGRCITTIVIRSASNATGQVACGNAWRQIPKGEKPWGFGVKYRWNGKGYTWLDRYEYGVAA